MLVNDSEVDRDDIDDLLVPIVDVIKLYLYT